MVTPHTLAKLPVSNMKRRDSNTPPTTTRTNDKMFVRKFASLTVLVSIISLGLGILGGRYLSGRSDSSEKTASAKSVIYDQIPSTTTTTNKKLTVAIHHAGDPITLHRDNDPLSDACVLLSSCFPDNFFGLRPDLPNPLQKCHSNMRLLLGSYDSGFMYEGERLVGFISSILEERMSSSGDESRPVVELYNVCIRKEDRGRGLAKTLVNDYLKQLFADHNVKAALVGLDVNFESPDSAAAFTLYAKLGFLRWWEPCRTIGRFDFTKLYPSASEQNKKRLPLSGWWQAIGDPGLIRQKMGMFTHFCMVKEWPGDDLYTLGSQIKLGVSENMQERKKTQ